MAETYLHGHHDSVLRSHRWRTAENSASYLLPYLPADAQVLDVGCGPGDRAVEQGLARRADLERLALAWLRWADREDGWFCIPHGEIVCRV
jgi:hypothetical protein